LINLLITSLAKRGIFNYIKPIKHVIKPYKKITGPFSSELLMFDIFMTVHLDLRSYCGLGLIFINPPSIKPRKDVVIGISAHDVQISDSMTGSHVGEYPLALLTNEGSRRP